MSTTFAVRTSEGVEVPVAIRTNGIRWLDPLGPMLDDNVKVIPIDNTAQGIYHISDIKQAIKNRESCR